MASIPGLVIPRLHPKNVSIGDKFNRWTVIDQPIKNKHSSWFAICQCDCGTKKRVNIGSVVTGATKSCGCLMKETTARLSRSHGMYGTRTYEAWHSMKSRCCNPNAGNYGQYGAKGVTVCSEWLDSFEQFYADMSECPSGFTLDRIDYLKGYEPGNCRWADAKTQARNKSNNVMVEFNGDTRCVSGWAEIRGIDPETMRARFNSGWSAEDAITKPLDTRFSSKFRDGDC